jgi:ubiquinone/menaquinone biosynthesis C-methylase UbiE
MSHGTLYDHPDLYDLVTGANPTAEAFYSQEAHQRGTCVLELACGSGRFSIAMAQSGLNVVSGDLSSAMLERARAKAESAGVHIPLIQLDMRDFSLPARLLPIHYSASCARWSAGIRRFRSKRADARPEP